jgi:hypothetical protein
MPGRCSSRSPSSGTAAGSWSAAASRRSPYIDDENGLVESLRELGHTVTAEELADAVADLDAVHRAPAQAFWSYAEQAASAAACSNRCPVSGWTGSGWWTPTPSG